MFGRRMYDIVILYDNLNDVNAYYTIVDFKAADKGLYVFMNFLSNEWGGQDVTFENQLSNVPYRHRLATISCADGEL